MIGRFNIYWKLENENNLLKSQMIMIVTVVHMKSSNIYIQNNKKIIYINN